MKKTVVFSILGTTLDSGKVKNRWNHWRPTVSICQQEDLLVDRLEMIHSRKSAKLAEVIGEDIALVSPETTVQRHLMDFRNPWDLEEVYSKLLDFTEQYQFDTESEDYLVNITTGTHVIQICLFLLTESRHFPARLLQTHPPTVKDGVDRGGFAVVDLDLSKYDRLAMRFQEQARDDISFLKAGIETRNQAFNDLIERMERVAIRSSAPILLTGPTGAGKSSLARRIYELKKTRRVLAGNFVEVNCGTIRGDGAMSTLFGHRRGAFTGAVADREGLLRAADSGLLFLDEVGELGPDEQAMLLRAIEEKRFLPVGSDKEVSSDFQLICGTNRDLQAEVERGAFREDLLSRLNLWTFRLPGLSERHEDIGPNIDYELTRLARKSGKRVTFNKEARERFLTFATSPEALWRANFRDLNGAVLRMATLADGGRITIDVMHEEIQRLSDAWTPRGQGGPVEDVLGMHQAALLDPFDKAQLAEVLRACRESRTLSEAGRKLFAVSRLNKKSVNDADRLKKYLARFGLDFSEV